MDYSFLKRKMAQDELAAQMLSDYKSLEKTLVLHERRLNDFTIVRCKNPNKIDAYSKTFKINVNSLNQ